MIDLGLCQPSTHFSTGPINGTAEPRSPPSTRSTAGEKNFAGSRATSPQSRMLSFPTGPSFPRTRLASPHANTGVPAALRRREDALWEGSIERSLGCQHPAPVPAKRWTVDGGCDSRQVGIA